MHKYHFLFFLLPLLGFSQNFEGEDYMYLMRHEHVKISLDDNTFKVVHTMNNHGKFLTSKNLYHASKSIGYSSFHKIEDIEAYTYIPSLDKKIKVDYIETQQEFDDMVFYSDDEYKSFIFPAVKKDAETFLSYKITTNEPYFLGSFNFAIHVPTKSAKLSVEFPKNIEIGYREFNTDSIHLDFKKEETDSSFLYTWTATNTDGFEVEADSENPLYYLPHIVMFIKNYKTDNETIGISGTLDNVYNWNVSLIKQIDQKDLKKVYDLTDNITKGLTSERAMAKAIFEWVQDNINYIAFSDEYNGLIPAGAAATCDTRYGDCKAMSNLLYEMLNYKGIEAYRTWIGSRRLPYAYTELPSSSVSNHMITTAIIEKDTIFLDATNSYVPYGMPSAFIQNKEGLMGVDDKNYKIVKVPVQPSDLSVTKSTTNMTIENGVVKVSDKRLLTGYDKVDFISEYTFGKDGKTDEEFLNTNLILGNNKTEYSNFSKTNLDNNTEPLELAFDLEIDSYLKTIGNKIYLNPNIDKSLSSSDIDIKNRKHGKKIDYPFEKHFVTNFQIPEGYSASYIPDEKSFKSPSYGFNIKYHKEGNTIIQTKTIYVKTLSIKKEEFENWNLFIKNLRKAYKKSIILEQAQ